MSILGAIVIIFVAFFIVAKGSGTKNSPSPDSRATPTSHIEGNGSKNVTLVEYGDYQCPICGIYYQPLKAVAAQFNNEIHFQFRNLPLTSVHPNAFAAARAAEAAGMQNKYWEMHDLLYQNQSDWSVSSSPLTIFQGYASTLGLDTAKFKSDYASSKVNDSINADLAAFNKTGQQMATPTFFLDGQYLPNANVSDSRTGQPSVDKFAAVLQAEINKKK
ncbi:MAG: Na+/H+ antiporter, NhaA family protein nonfunctional [Candidatus Saccharibacteria bacterium]|nr:Na+/H+ antiporter, NhaA family protein nonfunctional [Candidatus Saccharibacteria bacterium]